MANLNLYKSYTKAFFASSRRLPDIHISNLVTLNTMYNVLSAAIRCQIHDFRSDDNSNTMYNVLSAAIRCQIHDFLSDDNSNTMYDVLSAAIRYQIHDFLSDDNSNICISSLTCQNRYLKSLNLKI